MEDEKTSERFWKDIFIHRKKPEYDRLKWQFRKKKINFSSPLLFFSHFAYYGGSITEFLDVQCVYGIALLPHCLWWIIFSLGTGPCVLNIWESFSWCPGCTIKTNSTDHTKERGLKRMLLCSFEEIELR